MMSWNYGDWPFGMSVMALLMIAFWALVIWALFRLVKNVSTGSAGSQTPGATEVLARRFATGEINEDEYRSRLAVLSGRGAGPGP